MKQLKKLAAVALAAVVTMPIGATGASAAPVIPEPLNFSEFATHPTASKTGYDYTSRNYYQNRMMCTPEGEGGWYTDSDLDGFCPVGQRLVDMGFTADGKLVAGHGDWNSNVDSFGVIEGRPSIAELDVATGEWGTVFPVGSEGFDVVREREGNLYVPYTDPSDRGGNFTGYWTNKGGEWHRVKHLDSSTHVIDITAKNDTVYSLAEFGTANGGGTSVQVSDGLSDVVSSTMDRQEIARTETRDGWARNSWIVSDGDGLIRSYFNFYGSSDRTVRRMDSAGTWSDFSLTDYPFQPKFVEQFGDQAVIGSNGKVNFIHNGEITKKDINEYGSIKDMYVDNNGDGSLYVLTNRFILKAAAGTTELEPIEILDTSSVSSIAVRNGYAYFGGFNGKIYKSDNPIGTQKMIMDEVIIDNVTPTKVKAGAVYEVTITGDNLDIIDNLWFAKEGGSFKVDGVNIISRTNNEIVFEADVTEAKTYEKLNKNKSTFNKYQIGYDTVYNPVDVKSVSGHGTPGVVWYVSHSTGAIIKPETLTMEVWFGNAGSDVVDNNEQTTTDNKKGPDHPSNKPGKGNKTPTEETTVGTEDTSLSDNSGNNGKVKGPDHPSNKPGKGNQ